MRSLCQISTAEGGLTLANRGLPEVEVLNTPAGAEMALTLLRCVGWLSRDDLETRRGHAGTAIQTPSAQMLDKWSFDYALLPYTGTDPQPCRELARGFETPLRGVFTPADAIHQVKLPVKGSFVEITPADLTGRFNLSAVKQAEDGSGWLLRGYSTSDEPIEIRISPIKPFKNAALANLAEQPIIPLYPDPKDGRYRIILKPREIITLWLGQ
jgi:alpha-mannosidase